MYVSQLLPLVSISEMEYKVRLCALRVSTPVLHFHGNMNLGLVRRAIVIYYTAVEIFTEAVALVASMVATATGYT